MPSLIQDLLAEGPVLTDGAWGTELQARGLPPGACPDLWNLEAPDRVEEVARAYVDAGSRIILTNTFGANRFVLAGRGMADEAAEIARRGARISRSAAGDRAFVFGSIGPSGKMLLTGEVEPADLREAFAEQALALAEGGADALVVETMADLDEALLALEGARRTGLPVVACLVFDSGRDLDRTMMGTTPEQGAAALADAGADVVGANCGQGIEGFASLCRRMRDAAGGRPVWIKANAGLPRMDGDQAVYEIAPDEFAARAPGLVEAGAAFLGGCCGTGPQFIRALRSRLQTAPPTR